MINNRLTALEQRLKPALDTREPLLVKGKQYHIKIDPN